MDHGFGKGPPARVFAREEEGGAALETALLLGLTAFFAFTVREIIATPLLATFTKAAQVVSQALAG
jgi:Flp pilus assembly pilin Flp